MKRVVIINKSDSTGGAAVVSFRLMMALRSIGVDARMIVAEKLTDSPYVVEAAPQWRLKWAFVADRLKIAIANGFDRATLFKLDAAVAGINLADHPLVREADAVLINWINQGLLSLKDIKRIGNRGKRLIWTMHDMWNMTGICHHAGECRRYVRAEQCGECPFLSKYGSPDDLSKKTLLRKQKLYADVKIDFVAVSSWLAGKACTSTLLGGERVSVIPNAFILPDPGSIRRVRDESRLRLIFGAARLDDDVKGFPIFIEAMRRLKEDYPEIARRTIVRLYGSIRDKRLIDMIPLDVEYSGLLHDHSLIEELYCNSDIVVSTSLYETLPGTLVEGQAYGALPVSFDRGGQRDIVVDGETGMLVEWSDDISEAGRRMAAGIVRGAEMLNAGGKELRKRMYESVKSKFDAVAVAKAYLHLICSD